MAVAPAPARSVAVRPAAGHLPALTGLRFFLAIWVVLHHLSSPGMMLDPWARTLPPGLLALLRSGYLAVGTFFALSGFVLTRRYAATTWTPKSLFKYAVSRVARIYPVYLLSLVLVTPFMIRDFRPAWIANYVLLLQGWFDKEPVGWNTPAWSLSCEIFFYCCFPAAILLLSHQSWTGALTLGAAACMLTGTMRQLGFQEAWKPLLHFSDFLIGIAAANAYALLQRRRAKLRIDGRWLYWPACAATVALMARPDMVGRWATLNGLLRPLNAAILIGLALGGGLLARILSAYATVYLGKASYSLYILHIPLLWWYTAADPINPLPRTASAVVYTLMVIGVSAVVFRWVEEPANARLRDAIQRRASILRASRPSS